jgi:hypothetical protein
MLFQKKKKNLHCRVLITFIFGGRREETEANDWGPLANANFGGGSFNKGLVHVGGRLYGCDIGVSLVAGAIYIFEANIY